MSKKENFAGNYFFEKILCAKLLLNVQNNYTQGLSFGCFQIEDVFFLTSFCFSQFLGQSQKFLPKPMKIMEKIYFLCCFALKVPFLESSYNSHAEKVYFMHEKCNFHILPIFRFLTRSLLGKLKSHQIMVFPLFFLHQKFIFWNPHKILLQKDCIWI